MPPWCNKQIQFYNLSSLFIAALFCIKRIGKCACNAIQNCFRFTGGIWSGQVTYHPHSWQFWWDWPLMCSIMLFLFFYRSNDSGLLSHKEHLPVRVLAVGDINRLGSEAAYRVGPLQCYGDSKYRTDLITLWALTLSTCQTHRRYISSARLPFHVLNENHRRTI